MKSSCALPLPRAETAPSRRREVRKVRFPCSFCSAKVAMDGQTAAATNMRLSLTGFFGMPADRPDSERFGAAPLGNGRESSVFSSALLPPHAKEIPGPQNPDLTPGS